MKTHLVRACLLCSIILAFSLSVSSRISFAQELGRPQANPKWFENIVAEFHGYHWFTDGDVTHRHLVQRDGRLTFSHIKYDTDSNLYIIGGESGYRFGLSFLKRVTAGYETSQGSSDTMHGTDSDPFLSFQKHSGEDSTKYIRPTLYLRPLEGKITTKVRGYFDISGEWIRYKDGVHVTSGADISGGGGGGGGAGGGGSIPPPPGGPGDFGGGGGGGGGGGRIINISAASDNPFKTRYEGAGVGFRGGLGFFDMFKLEGLFTYYPDMSVKRTYRWDVPANRKFVFFDDDGEGFTSRITLGFTPPVKSFKGRKNLELEFGYQYMQFEQTSGKGRVVRFSDGASTDIHNWTRGKSIRDGFFVGGTIRW